MTMDKRFSIDCIFYPLFFIGLLIYHAVFNTLLYHHLHQPVFLHYLPFFRDFISHPGGLSEWITEFIFQFFYIKWLGVLILSVIMWTILFLVHRIIKKTGILRYGILFASVPVFLLIALQSGYHMPPVIHLKILLSVTLLFGTQRIREKGRIFILLLSPLFYILLGGWFYISLIAAIVLMDLMEQEELWRILLPVAHALFALLMPYISARYIYLVPLKEAYQYILASKYFFQPFSIEPGFSFYLLCFYLPVLLILMLIIKLIQNKKLFKNIPSSLKSGMPIIEWGVVLVIGILTATLSFSKKEKMEALTDYFAATGQWDKLIDVIENYESYNKLVTFNTNRAYEHTGQLLDKLFTYPQPFGTEALFVNKIMASQIALYASDLYFDLGHINAAQVMAYEYQTKYKYNPRVLKRLALTNLINGDYRTAAPFLDILEKSRLHRDWAGKYKTLMKDETKLAQDPLIKQKRAQKPAHDFFINNEFPNVDLKQLLLDHANNQFAFDYLIAYYLLEGGLKNLMMHLEDFPEYGYQHLPVTMQQALLFSLMVFKSNLPFDPKSVRIEKEINDDFVQFVQLLRKERQHDTSATAQIWKEFRHTYWYYLAYTLPRIKQESEGR